MDVRRRARGWTIKCQMVVSRDSYVNAVYFNAMSIVNAASIANAAFSINAVYAFFAFALIPSFPLMQRDCIVNALMFA